jgi:hypothetical protein
MLPKQIKSLWTAATAKITSQHSLKYAYLKKEFGFESAKIYADSNQ